MAQAKALLQQCNIAIWHGPGHQSMTFCAERAPHELHSVEYGEFSQLAEWVGDDAFSGAFDEPPGPKPGYVPRQYTKAREIYGR